MVKMAWNSFVDFRDIIVIYPGLYINSTSESSASYGNLTKVDALHYEYDIVSSRSMT